MASAANIAKSDFIATASHDLRQPMQARNARLANERVDDAKREAQAAETKLQNLLEGAANFGYEFEIDPETGNRSLVKPRFGWAEDPG